MIVDMDMDMDMDMEHRGRGGTPEHGLTSCGEYIYMCRFPD